MPATFVPLKLQLLALIFPLILLSFAIEGCKSKKQDEKNISVTNRPPQEDPEPAKPEGPEDKTKESSENSESTDMPEPPLDEKTNDHVDMKEETVKSENLIGKSQEERFPETFSALINERINELPEQISTLREAITTYGMINAKRRMVVTEEKNKIHELMVQIKASVDLFIKSGNEKYILSDLDFVDNIDEYNELVAVAIDTRATYRRHPLLIWWRKQEPVLSPVTATNFLIVYPEIDTGIFSEITSRSVELLFRDHFLKAPDDEEFYLNLATEISNLKQTVAFIKLLEHGVTEHSLYENVVRRHIY